MSPYRPSVRVMLAGYAALAIALVLALTVPFVIFG